MATQAQQPGQMSLPLQNEMQLANWVSSLFSGKTANPNYTGGKVAPPQLVDQLSGQDMQNLMTEFLRGNGNFLQNMMQQNQAGLYNTNTRRLVANDLTAQAALKASQANVPIQQGNAQLMNAYYSKLAAQAPKYLPSSSRNDALGGLAIAGLQQLLKGGKDKKQQGSKESSSTDSEKSAESGGNIFDQITEFFSPSADTSSPVSLDSIAPQMSVDPGSLLGDMTGAQYDFGMSVDPGLSFDFGSVGSDYNFQPDTYESFTDSYGTAPGYDYQDYSEYFFDY